MHLLSRKCWTDLTPLGLFLLAGAALACGDSTTGPDGRPATPKVLQSFSGDRQQATAGTALAQPLVVEVLGAQGEPVGGATVTFAVDSGNGSVTPTSEVTNSSGQARTTFTLGSVAGTQTVTATVSGLPPVSFTETATAGAATQVVATGNAQTGAVGDLLPSSIVLRVVDGMGNGVAGVTLTATPATGSGAFAFNTPTSDASGNVTALWRLGTTPGPQHVTVSAGSGNLVAPLTLAATAVAGPPDTVAVIQGTGQTGQTGDQLTAPFVVRVVDRFGNPIPALPVVMSADGGGTLTPGTATTDSTGRASAVWTLGNTAGTQYATATATAGGATRTRQISATALAPSPATMWLLDHDVVDAEYSASADVIVTVSANPSRLNIIDPNARTIGHVDLPQVPLAVSVDPAGTHAAVSHDGLVSYVNLANGTLERTYPLTSVGGDIVLAGNGYAYVFPRSDQWVSVHCIDLTTGTETKSSSPYAGAVARLDPLGPHLYAATNGLTPSTIDQYDISTGIAQGTYHAPYWGQYEPLGNLWFYGDGSHIVARSGYVYNHSSSQASDLTYSGALSGLKSVQAAVQVSGTARLYVLGNPNPPASIFSPDPVPAYDVRSYETQFLGLLGSVPLPRFRVPTSTGTTSYASEGRFLFENSGATHVYALVHAPSGSGIAQSWGVAVFKTSDLP